MLRRIGIMSNFYFNNRNNEYIWNNFSKSSFIKIIMPVIKIIAFSKRKLCNGEIFRP